MLINEHFKLYRKYWIIHTFKNNNHARICTTVLSVVYHILNMNKIRSWIKQKYNYIFDNENITPVRVVWLKKNWRNISVWSCWSVIHLYQDIHRNVNMLCETQLKILTTNVIFLSLLPTFHPISHSPHSPSLTHSSIHLHAIFTQSYFPLPKISIPLVAQTRPSCGSWARWKPSATWCATATSGWSSR